MNEMNKAIEQLPAIEKLIFTASTMAPDEVMTLAEEVRREMYAKDELIEELKDRVKAHAKRATAAEDRIRYVQRYLEHHFEEYQYGP